MSSGAELIRRRQAVVARGVGMFAGDTTIVSAKGARLVDCDGREIIDFAGGLGVMNAGHCDESVVAAIQQQAANLIHACIHVATYEPYVALCEKLTTLVPHGDATKAMLVNSGAEAVENAVKIARQATGRPAVLCFSGGFHGRTLLGMTLTAKSAYKRGCGPFAPEVYRAPFPNYFRNGDGLDEATFVARELDRLRESFVTGPIPAEHVGAAIIEVVQGEGGFVPAPPAYIQGLRALCDELGILLICDEVQSGFCRTGRWAAYEHSGVVPDLSTWAKSMGGGMPIGAVIGRAEVMDAAQPGTIGGTYGGNPVACAGALATIDVMERHDLCGRAQTIGRRIRERLTALREHCPAVADVRGLGAMVGVELCHDADPGRPATALVQDTAARCRAAGVLVLTAGPFSNVLRILSPLVIEDEDLERGLDVIEQSLQAAMQEQST
jgi:4-aminobutyrate aminotransferase / (S)-3-amino-2-methylpropionate transaminase / 5-aminovalerate transaminase